jgi:hypothetical protein
VEGVLGFPLFHALFFLPFMVRTKPPGSAESKSNVKEQASEDWETLDCVHSSCAGIYHSDEQDEMRATESNA